MARHKNRKKTPAKSGEVLTTQGAAALRAGRYKDAVNVYKQLLKTEAREEWKTGLASAYLGRARELAAKGLYEEALAVLDNAASQNSAIDFLEEFIHWSICLGRYEAAAKVFFKSRDLLAKDRVGRLESIFALAAASLNQEIAELFPEESKIRKDLPTIRQAIKAYCENDRRKLEDLLAKISFHSPYRDLRSILSVLSADASGDFDGKGRLSKIKTDSAFKPAARVVELALCDPLKPEQLKSTSEPEEAFILAVQGLNGQNWDLIEKISTAKASAKQYFSLLINDPSVREDKLLQDLCYRLLPQYPSGIPLYEKRIAPLPLHEKRRIQALALEKHKDFENAATAWAAASDAIPELGDSRDKRLIRAVFLRHAADCAELSGNFFSTAPQDYLEESLELDLDDAKTYYRLFKIYRNFDPDAYRSAVERAVKHFPEDSEILTAAIELAIERNAFKKAAKLANTLVTLDPINHRARVLLVKAHLSHAGKLIAQAKFDLAAKEIDAAQEFEADNRPSGLVPLYRGLLEYALGHEAEGERLIDLACKASGGYLGGYFKTAVEMIRLKIPARHRKKYLSLLRHESDRRPEKASFLSLIREIQQVSREKNIEFSLAMGSLNKYLKAATSLELGREEMEWVCDTFQSMEMYQQLADFAEAAVKRWPDSPVFDYFAVYARSRGDASSLSVVDSRRLEAAIDKAEQQRNHRLANRLIDYLGRGVFANDFKNASAPFEFDEVIEKLIEHIPDSDKLLEMVYGGQDDDCNQGSAKPRKSRETSSQAPKNRDIFDDRSF